MSSGADCVTSSKQVMGRDLFYIARADRMKGSSGDNTASETLEELE